MSAAQAADPAGVRLPGARWVVRALDALTRLAFAASTSLLVAITAIYCLEIVRRYFFNAPSVWAQDTITYFLVAMICLAIPEMARTRGHISITVLLDLLPPHRRGVCLRLLDVLVAGVAAGMVYITGMETWKLYVGNILTLGTVMVPKWWISVFIPLGFALLGLQYLRHAIEARPVPGSTA